MTPSGARRRDNGQGTVYQQANGLWAAQVMVNGKRHVGRAKTEHEARVKLRAMRKRAEEGQLVRDSSMTVKDFFRLWSTTDLDPAANNGRRPATKAMYRSLVRGHVVPIIGQLKLREVDRQHVADVLAQSVANGLKASSSQRSLHSAMRAMFDAAIPHMILRNPVADVARPKVTAEPPPWWTVEEVQTFLTVNRDDPWYPLWCVFVDTTMRRGEALGLRWSDIDMTSGQVIVQRSLGRSEGSPLADGPTKGGDGRSRVNVLSPATMAELRRHRKAQRLRQMAAGPRWQESERVFTNSVGGPQEPTEITRKFKRAAAAAGLECHGPHVLRHSSITAMIDAGMLPKDVAEVAGHYSWVLTAEVYAHTDASRAAAANRALHGIVAARPPSTKVR